MNNKNTNILSSSAKNNLYQTSNSQYGTAWIQSGTRPEQTNIKTDVVPTYS